MADSLQAPRPSDGTHLLDYIRVLLKRLWLIVGVFVLVVGIVGVVTWRATPLFRATATINIQPPNVVWGQLDPMAASHSVNQSQRYMNTQYALLRQPSLIGEAVRNAEMEKWRQFKDLGMAAADIIGSIVGNVTVQPDKETNLVRVSVVSADRKVVARITNELIGTFKRIQSGEARGALQARINALETRSLEYRSRAEITNADIDGLMSRNNTDRETFLEALDSARSRYKEMLRQEDDTEAELSRLKPRRDRIDRAMKSGDGRREDGLEQLFGETFVQENPLVQSEGKAIEKLEHDVLVLGRDKGPEHELVVALNKEIQDRRRGLAYDCRRILKGYLSKYEDLVAFKGDLGRRMEDFGEEIKALSRIKRDYDILIKRFEQLQSDRERYFAVFEKLEMSTDREVEPVIIVQGARTPRDAFKPDKQTNMILAVVFGLLAGMGVAFFLEYMDDTVKTKDELQRITDVPLFGVIPNITARRGEVQKKDLFAYNQPKSTISEAFRGIRTAISYSSQRKENRVYLVTSSGPKEGKSTITINVATVMAYSGTKTILIDADLRRPRIHKSFDLNNTRGLTNVIIGDASVEDVVQPTAVENLYVLPSGPIPPNPSELLGRERMVEVLEELRGLYDRIMLDTPPIGAVTDAAVLGRIVDSVILVVHAGKTRKKMIARGLEQLNQIDVDVSGIVLNNLKVGRKRYYPGYYDYYYYYASYYGADDEPRPKKKDVKRV